MNVVNVVRYILRAVQDYRKVISIAMRSSSPEEKRVTPADESFERNIRVINQKPKSTSGKLIKYRFIRAKGADQTNYNRASVSANIFIPSNCKT